MKFKIGFFAFMTVCGIAAQAADNNTYTATISAAGTFDWSALTWSGGDSSDLYYPRPKEGADIIIKLSKTTIKDTIKLDSAFPMSFTSWTWSGLAANTTYVPTLQSYSTTSIQNLTIGSGGITTDNWVPNYGTMTLTLGESQTYNSKVGTGWKIDNMSTFPVTLKSAEDVVWTVTGRNRLKFTDGSSSQFLGKLVLSSAMYFQGTTQFDRLPSGGVTFTTDATTPYPMLVWNFERNDGEIVLSMPFTFNVQKTFSDGTFGTMPPWIAMAATDSSPDMRLRFTGPVNGSIASGCLWLGQVTGNYNGTTTRPNYAGLSRTDQQRITFENDNHDLVAAANGARIWISSIVELAHQNALGIDNAQFDYQFHYGNMNCTDGRTMRAVMGLLASNGVNVAGNVYLEHNHGTSATSYGRMATVVLGSEGPGTSEFSGSIARVNSTENDYRRHPEVRFQGGEGGKAVFSGKIDGCFNKTVIGLGDVEITGTGNSFASDPVGFRVRSGRLVISNADAIRNSASEQDLLLGDEVPTNVTVRAYFGGRWDLSKVGSKAPVLGNYGSATNNLLSFTAAPTVDDITLEEGDLVLVSGMGQIATSSSTLYVNGIWEVMEGLKKWRRVEWLDEDEEVLTSHGLRVTVSDGTKFKGRTFFLANYENQAYDQYENGFHFAGYWQDEETYKSGAKNPYLLFQDEPSENPDVGFLLDGSFDYARPFKIANNLSTGKSEIGTVSSGSSSFSGLITVDKGEVYLTAAQGGTVKITNIKQTDDFKTSIVKEGLGTVDLSDTDQFKLTGSKLTVREGTLKVPADFIGTKELTIGCADTSCGTLAVVGDIDLTDREINIEDLSTRDHETSYTLVSSTGKITGTPKLIGGGAGWNVVNRGNKIAVVFGSGAVMFWRRGAGGD